MLKFFLQSNSSEFRPAKVKWKFESIGIIKRWVKKTTTTTKTQQEEEKEKVTLSDLRPRINKLMLGTKKKSKIIIFSAYFWLTVPEKLTSGDQSQRPNYVFRGSGSSVTL